jgi:hypothetical protein
MSQAALAQIRDFLDKDREGPSKKKRKKGKANSSNNSSSKNSGYKSA